MQDLEEEGDSLASCLCLAVEHNVDPGRTGRMLERPGSPYPYQRGTDPYQTWRLVEEEEWEDGKSQSLAEGSICPD